MIPTPSQTLLLSVITLNDCFVKINEKGFVPDDFSFSPIFVRIGKYIKSLGYKVPFEFGENENTLKLGNNHCNKNGKGLIEFVFQLVKYKNRE